MNFAFHDQKIIVCKKFIIIFEYKITVFSLIPLLLSSATAVLTVTNAVIVSISVTPENSTIENGASQKFTATGTFSDDSEQDITELANWLTFDNSIGTISNSPDSRGSFSSIASGSTTIEASFGGISGETLLTVVE